MMMLLSSDPLASVAYSRGDLSSREREDAEWLREPARRMSDAGAQGDGGRSRESVARYGLFLLGRCGTVERLKDGGDFTWCVRRGETGDARREGGLLMALRET